MIKSMSSFWVLCFRVASVPALCLGSYLFMNTILSLFWMELAVGSMYGGLWKATINMSPQGQAFLAFCLSIGFFVVYFSVYYIPKEEVSSFTWVIFTFIVLMILLTSGANPLFMFLGWEGVGIMSFLLIGWFSSREEAVLGSKKAVLFNRGTDFFFMVVVFWELGELQGVFSSEGGSPALSLPLTATVMLGGAIYLSGVGKSAQFLFHPWLTAAMEGPTPVSSLLHSSTMVVAGVFLMFSISPFLESGNWEVLLCVIFFSSVVTIWSTSLWAFSQMDLKKIIALSTTSQLSFMMMLISLGQGDLAFLHMILHGYFKALVFMGSGVAIHNRINMQDCRFLGVGPQPFFFNFFLLGSFGLMGLPFLGAFFSKHKFLDFLTVLHMGETCLQVFLVITTTALTAGYSLKMMSVVYQTSPNKGFFPFWNLELSGEVIPMFILSLGVLFSGSLIGEYLEGAQTSASPATPFAGVNLVLILLIGSSLFWYMKPNSLYYLSFHSINTVQALAAFIKSWGKLLFALFMEVLHLKGSSKSSLLASVSGLGPTNKSVGSFLAFSTSFFGASILWTSVPILAAFLLL